MGSLLVKLDPGARTPTKGYLGDAGFDMYCSESVDIEPGSWKDVDLGVSIQLPPKHWGLLTGRSSTLRRRGLLVNQGIIDNGYRGKLFANVVNMTDETVSVKEGERLAQLILLPVWDGVMEVATELAPSARGDNGFGSTGR